MAEVIHGRNVLAYVDVGSSTMTAFDREISCSYSISGTASAAVDKTTTGAANHDYQPGQVHTITVTGHIQDSQLCPAFDKVMTDIRAQTKTAVQFVENATDLDVHDTYGGLTSKVVWTSYENNAPNDPYTKTVTGVWDGLPAQATSA